MSDDLEQTFGKDVAGIVDSYCHYQKTHCILIERNTQLFECESKILNGKIWINHYTQRTIMVVTLNNIIELVDDEYVEDLVQNFTRVFAYNGETYILLDSGIYKFVSNNLIIMLELAVEFNNIESKVDVRHFEQIYHAKDYVFVIRRTRISSNNYENQIFGVTYDDLFQKITEMKRMELIEEEFDKEYLANNIDKIYKYQFDLPMCVYERNGKLMQAKEPNECFICQKVTCNHIKNFDLSKMHDIDRNNDSFRINLSGNIGSIELIGRECYSFTLNRNSCLVVIRTVEMHSLWYIEFD